MDFEGFSYFPVKSEQRMRDAWWDALGKPVYIPSSQLFISVFCSCPESLADVLVAEEFPHEQFSRWDILLHKPDCLYEGDRKPEMAAKFVLDGEVRNSGFYHQLPGEEIPGYGYPDIEHLLQEPYEGEEIYSDIAEQLVHMEKSPEANIEALLTIFSEMVVCFDEGWYNEELGVYDFGENRDSAIRASEKITGEESLQRYQGIFSSS